MNEMKKNLCCKRVLKMVKEQMYPMVVDSVRTII